VVSRYREKVERGMTDREILSILNEFEAAGIEEPPIGLRPLDGSFREKQQEWYFAALVDALNLSSEQKEAARRKMRGLLDEDLAAFHAGIAGIGGDTGIPKERLPDHQPIAPSSINPLLWLSKESYAPWRLIDLTPEQEALTVKSLEETGWSSAVPSSEETGDRLSIWVPGILVRTAGQPEQGDFHGDSLVDAVRHLHPAQLRLALLVNPVIAPLLAVELNQADQP
jgi:hypothetical protein